MYLDIYIAIRFQVLGIASEGICLVSLNEF